MLHRALLLTCLASLALPAFAAAQLREEYPPLYKPKTPPALRDLERREALHHYLLALIYERQDRLLDALKAHEKAAELDPDAPAVLRAQVTLLLLLERPKEALARSTRVFELDPEDFENAFVLARLNKGAGKYKEAIAVLDKAVGQPALKKAPTFGQQIHFDLAQLYETSEEFAKAAAEYTRAAAILDHPEMLGDDADIQRNLVLAKAAETYERIGHLQRKVKQYDKAIEAFQNAQKRMPDAAGRLSYNLAQVAAEQGQLEEGLRYLDEHLRLQPLIVDPYELKITLLTKLKREADILPWLDKAVQADRNNADLRLLLAKQYESAGKAKEAEKTYSVLAKEAPRPDVFRGLFRLQRADASRGMVHVLFQLNKAIKEASGKPPEPDAAAQAKAMIGAVRDDGDLARGLVDVAFRLGAHDDELEQDTLHLLAALADKHRKTDEAERFYRKALDKTTVGLEALVYNGLLRTLWQGQKYEAIVEICERGLDKATATNKLLFYNDLSRAQARLGRTKEALAAIDKGIDLAGDQHVLTMKITRIRILAQADMLDEAEKECAALLKEFSQPGDVQEIRYILSTVYSGRKKLAQAEEQLELILNADPNNATVNNDLGYIWADHGKNLDKAEEMIRRALELDRRQRKLIRAPSEEEDQDNAAFVDSLGWVLFRKGQIDDAVKELARAVRLPGGDDPTLWDHLGDAQHRLGRFADARASWETSVRLFEKEARRRADERCDEVRRKLKMLEKRAGGG
jgi:tetratricopeptide (TPR) repeat protein